MITDNYIRMCEQAEEIQKLWKPKIGDWYVDFEGDVECVALMGESIIEHHSKYDKWLPTQEQLQEMLFQGFDEYEHWIRKLYDFILDLPLSELMSMNELWLAFVMKEKYDKTWTGEKWEVIK